ncbi:MAG: hypothetical protein WD738_21915 [Pirellulales bacterium]
MKRNVYSLRFEVENAPRGLTGFVKGPWNMSAAITSHVDRKPQVKGACDETIKQSPIKIKGRRIGLCDRPGHTFIGWSDGNMENNVRNSRMARRESRKNLMRAIDWTNNACRAEREFN